MVRGNAGMHVHLGPCICIVVAVAVAVALAMGGGERGRREADGEPLALGGRSRVSASELLLPMLCMSAFFSSFPLSLMMRS